MSGVPIGAGVAIAVAAKKRREREQKEEEIMTKYNSNDLDGWEFKIVRSSTGTFKNLNKVQQLITEEAQSGWEMIEKFDNNRIRFKRKTTMCSQDAMVEIDPYRTNYGMSEGGLISILLGVILLVGGIFLLAFKFNNGAVAESLPMPFVVAGIIVLGLVMVYIKKRQ